MQSLQHHANRLRRIAALDKGLSGHDEHHLSNKEIRDRVAALANLLSYVAFLTFVCLVVFLSGDHEQPYRLTYSLEAALLDTVVPGHPGTTFRDMTTPAQMFDWMGEVFVPATTQQKYYNGRPFPLNENDPTAYQAYYTNGVSMTMGRARLRQLRVDGAGCAVADVFEAEISECFPPMSSFTEATAPKWRLNGTDASGAVRVFEYPLATDSDGHPFYSQRTKITYSNGGYEYDVPRGYGPGRAAVADLMAMRYVDAATRAVVLDFSVYNVNIDMFGTARFVFEFLPSGALVPSVELDSVPLLTDLRALQGDGSTTVKLVTVLLEFSLYAMVLAYLVTAADEIVDYRSFKEYMSAGWNVLDICNVLCFMAVVALRFEWMVRAAQLSYTVGYTFSTGNVEHDDYFEVRLAAETFRLGKACFAVGVLINFVKAFKYVQVSAHLSQFTTTVAKAYKDMLVLCTILCVIISGYGIAFHMVFGHRLDGYKDFPEAVFTLLLFLLGQFDFQSLVATSPVLGSLLFVSYAIIMVFVVLSMLLKIVDVAYNEVLAEISDGSEDTFAKDLKAAVRKIFHDAYWWFRLQRTLMEARVLRKKIRLPPAPPADPHAKRGKGGQAVPVAEMSAKLEAAAAAEAAAKAAEIQLAADDEPEARLSAVGRELKRERAKARVALSSRGKLKEPPESEMEAKRHAIIRRFIRDGKLKDITEDDIDEQDLVDRLDMLRHRQAILLKLVKRLDDAVGIAIVDTAEDADAGGARAKKKPQLPAGVVKPAADVPLTSNPVEDGGDTLLLPRVTSDPLGAAKPPVTAADVTRAHSAAAEAAPPAAAKPAEPAERGDATDEDYARMLVDAEGDW